MIKLLGFGIAGLTLDAPSYLSPEQAAGGESTPASDLYSTTIVLFEMLTGRTPGPREVVPGLELPAGLEALLGCGLAEAIAGRIPTAEMYLQMLDAIGDPGPPSPATMSVLPPPYRKDDGTMLVRPRPGPRIWIVLVSAVLAALALVGAYALVRSSLH